MVGLAWSTTFGTWEPKLGGTGTRGMDRGGQDGFGQAEGRGGTATRGRAKRRESSSFWYGGLARDAITLDCLIEQDPCIETRWIASQPIG